MVHGVQRCSKIFITLKERFIRQRMPLNLEEKIDSGSNSTHLKMVVLEISVVQ